MLNCVFETPNLKQLTPQKNHTKFKPNQRPSLDLFDRLSAPPDQQHKDSFFLPRLSSRFRYSGRTQSQIGKRNAQPIDRIPPPFSRSLSNKRYSLRSFDNGKFLSLFRLLFRSISKISFFEFKLLESF